jgi:hypothetical protein
MRDHTRPSLSTESLRIFYSARTLWPLARAGATSDVPPEPIVRIQYTRSGYSGSARRRADSLRLAARVGSFDAEPTPSLGQFNLNCFAQLGQRRLVKADEGSPSGRLTRLYSY